MTMLTQPIKVAIADDHPVVINGLQQMIARYPHITLTDIYINASRLLEGLQTEVPDVLLLDIQLPDRMGDELAAHILKKHTGLKIIALTNFNSILYVNSMFLNGAKGYLLKTADESTIIRAIETVHEGGEFLEPAMKEELRQYEANIRRMATLKATLTPREREILQLIADGHTGQEIAGKLFISNKTVEYYRSSILLKMDVKNVAELIKKAVTLGMVK